MSVRVLLCDDVAAYRTLVRVTLEEDPEIRVVAEADNGRAGVELAASVQPDVVLLDLSMPGLDGLEALPLIRERAPGAKVAVLSGFLASRMSEKVIRLGASAYLEKGIEMDALRRAVRELTPA